MVSLLATHVAQQRPLAYIFMAMKLWLMSWWIQVTCWIGIDNEIHDDDHDILIILIMVIIMITNNHLLGSRVALSSSHSHQKWGLVLKSALVQTILVWFGSNHLAGFGVPDFRFESHYQGPLSSGSKLYRSFNILTTPSSLYRSEWDWDCLGFFFSFFWSYLGLTPQNIQNTKCQ